ncbi:MAG: glucose-6-phosphate isomerase [Peptostreptococcales bacterium]
MVEVQKEKNNHWQRFKDYLFVDEGTHLQLDISKVDFQDDYFMQMEARIQCVYGQMQDLEAGAIANPDENRMVGHYWLRDPKRAPSKKIEEEIIEALASVKEFAFQIHKGAICGEEGKPFQNVLVIGIGGSSLGPRFVSHALGNMNDKMRLYFIDNTDPDGMDRIVDWIHGDLSRTLCVVVSKSGGTIETRNGMEEVRLFYQHRGLNFSKHAVSISQEGSILDQLSKREGWLKQFPLWDWIGGRTSVLSAVGLLPLALQGLDIELLLEGARQCDELTRKTETRKNPGALLALMWYRMTGGRGGKQMVLLPYKDRLELFTKYMQQLVMESLGKERDLDGNIVNQGIAVMGNKGSTDQHSYLQQLLDGPDNFFVIFLEILKDRVSLSPIIAEESTSGDYLHAFLLGTRKSLALKKRNSITITIGEINEASIGVLIALFERAVSMYAFLVHINAYHQPAVELGKKGAEEVIHLKNRIVQFLREHGEQEFTEEELANAISKNTDAEPEMVYKILQHLIHNPESGLGARKNKKTGAFDDYYRFIK